MQPASRDDAVDDAMLPLGQALRDAMAAWLAHLAFEVGCSENTLDAYERDLRQFLSWLKTDLERAPDIGDLAQLDAKRFRAFLAARRRVRLSSRSVARATSSLRTSSAGWRRRRSPGTARFCRSTAPRWRMGFPSR